mmetsp:Transcript_17954/g.50843  ORF Transcript_17954/g.50843 Transcript_17954/m.50843 type:complete len:232 (+) Transcript_17954:87-782(+)
MILKRGAPACVAAELCPQRPKIEHSLETESSEILELWSPVSASSGAPDASGRVLSLHRRGLVVGLSTARRGRQSPRQLLLQVLDDLGGPVYDSCKPPQAGGDDDAHAEVQGVREGHDLHDQRGQDDQEIKNVMPLGEVARAHREEHHEVLQHEDAQDRDGHLYEGPLRVVVQLVPVVAGDVAGGRAVAASQSPGPLADARDEPVLGVVELALPVHELEHAARNHGHNVARQ